MPERNSTGTLGRVLAPYGGIEHCANVDCPHDDGTVTFDEHGAYMYRDLETDKLVIFCGDCSWHAELNAPERFKLVAL